MKLRMIDDENDAVTRTIQKTVQVCVLCYLYFYSQVEVCVEQRNEEEEYMKEEEKKLKEVDKEEKRVDEKLEENSSDPLVAVVMTEVKLDSGTVVMEDRGVMMEEISGYIKISRV